MNEKLIDECINYFKSDKAFKKIMNELKNKYESLGTFGGTINIDEFTDEEINALCGLIGSDFKISGKKSIRVKKIIESLDDTKFAGVDFYRVICGYFNDTIMQKSEIRIYEEIKKEEFFYSLANCVGSDVASFITMSFYEKKGGAYTLLSSKYKEDSTGDKLKTEIIYLDSVVNYLKSYIENDKKIRLAILAAIVTGDPHALDEGVYLNNILTHFLCYIYNEKLPKNAEDKNYLFYRSGIMKDDISNNTLVLGIDGFYDEIYENKHNGWNTINNLYEPFIMSTYNITILNSMKPAFDEKVYILENPSVFMKLYEMSKTENKRISLVCSNGQVNTSTLLILDMLHKSGCKFYYSGDFDPEGIIILNKLLQRYGDNIEPFHYTMEDYLQVVSDKPIDDRRLKQLDKINDKRLLEVINKIKEIKQSGYQENIRYLL